MELVAHAGGVSLLTGETGLESVLRDVMETGVLPVACNTLGARDMTQDDLVDGVEAVDSGVAQLAGRQLVGWAYLRP